MEQQSPSPTEPLLSAIEARILGSLMEKQLTTPDVYPLTLNSLVLACNQKTSREPVSNYESGEVQRCVSALQDRKFIDVDYGTRAARYDQRLTRVVSVDKPAQALLCIMLLRGPQTLAELLTRTQRMYEFKNVEEIQEKLNHLCAKTIPAFMHIPRQPGQREDRYMHLLCGKPDLDAIYAASQTSSNPRSNQSDERVIQLEQHVESLQAQLALVQKQIKVLLELNGVSDEDIAKAG
jgi:uncharacterized protein YceH (UPF0502 family)